MPPQRTAPGVTAKAPAASASTSKSSKGKAAATANGNSNTGGIINPESVLPELAFPPTFSRTQAAKAVNALLSHAAKVTEEREETELMPREEHVWLTIALKQGATKKKVSPVRIQLPYPALPPPPATSICLLTKDPQREYKDLLEKQGVKFVSRVVGVTKLKGKFKPFEARRQLMKEHELFLCDERVVGLMPKLLGKIFYESKKLPIPVNLKKKDLKTELANAVNSTYFVPTTGTSLSVRISTPSTTTPSATLSNLLTSIPAVIAHLDSTAGAAGGWENILSIGIKTSSSILLPVWSATLAGRFDGPVKEAAAAAAAAAATGAGGKKEKRKSVFDEWASEEKEEKERANKFLVDNGETPEEEEKKEKKEGKGKKSKAVAVVEEEESDEEDIAEVEEGEDDEDEDEEEEVEVEPTPVAAPAPKKSTTSTKSKSSSASNAKPAGKKRATLGGGSGAKRLKAGVVGKSKK